MHCEVEVERRQRSHGVVQQLLEIRPDCQARMDILFNPALAQGGAFKTVTLCRE